MPQNPISATECVWVRQNSNTQNSTARVSLHRETQGQKAQKESAECFTESKALCGPIHVRLAKTQEAQVKALPLWDHHQVSLNDSCGPTNRCCQRASQPLSVITNYRISWLFQGKEGEKTQDIPGKSIMFQYCTGVPSLVIHFYSSTDQLGFLRPEDNHELTDQIKRGRKKGQTAWSSAGRSFIYPPPTSSPPQQQEPQQNCKHIPLKWRADFPEVSTVSFPHSGLETEHSQGLQV